MLRTPEPANGLGKTYVGKPTYLTKYLVKTQGTLGKTRALQISRELFRSNVAVVLPVSFTLKPQSDTKIFLKPCNNILNTPL